MHLVGFIIRICRYYIDNFFVFLTSPDQVVKFDGVVEIREQGAI